MKAVINQASFYVFSVLFFTCLPRRKHFHFIPDKIIFGSQSGYSQSALTYK